MIAFLLTIYSAIVILLLKFKIVKPRPYPLAIIAVVGVLILGGVVTVWVQCAPVSKRVVSSQYVVQLVPYVKGQVQKIHAVANQPVKKGDLLLEINPEPYQFAFDQAQAQLRSSQDNVKGSDAGLAAAKANVLKSKSSVTQAVAGINASKAAVRNAEADVAKSKAGVADAKAGVTKAQAANELAKTEEEIALNLRKMDAGAISVLRVTQATQNRQASDAALKQAQTGVDSAQAALQQTESGVIKSQAALQQAEAGLAIAQSAQQQAEAAERQASFSVEMAKSSVVAAQAQLDSARFNLDQCKMYAPSDGFVVNWQVREGTMLVPMPLAAAGTFISTAESAIVASFPQNYLSNVQPGDKVEVVLDPYPGKLFPGVVETVIPATGEGQFAPSGSVPDAAKVGSQGLLAVKIRLDAQGQPANLPLGAGGMVAIYTKSGKPVHVISKVSIRMQKWLLYLIPS